MRYYLRYYDTMTEAVTYDASFRSDIARERFLRDLGPRFVWVSKWEQRLEQPLHSGRPS